MSIARKLSETHSKNIKVKIPNEKKIRLPRKKRVENKTKNILLFLKLPTLNMILDVDVFASNAVTIME